MLPSHPSHCNEAVHTDLVSIIREIPTFLHKFTVISFYGITLFLCAISIWCWILFSSLFATSLTVSSVLNAVLPFCAVRNAALHSGLKYIHKVLKIAKKKNLKIIFVVFECHACVQFKN